MIIQRDLTIADTERLLREVDGLTTGQSITIPSRGSAKPFGGEAAYVQFLITWASTQTTAKIATYAQDEQDIQIARITNQLGGLAAILLADRVASKQGGDLTTTLLSKAIERLSLLNDYGSTSASRGPQFEIICADHLNLGVPRALYKTDREDQTELKGPSDFAAVGDEMMHALVPREMTRAIPPGFAQSISGAVHELFRNTEEHALLDEQGNRPKRSLRVIHARRHSLDANILDSKVSRSPMLAAFCGRLQTARPHNRHIQLVEVSILDSGKGMAASWTGAPLSDLSAEEEIDAVRACFRKHATRKRKASAGLGLPNVIDALRERGGFLRLRTGRLSLCADLGLESDRSYDEPAALVPVQPDGLKTAKVVGTLFSILVPLIVPE